MGHDLAVVGAGPAGCAAAATLVARGHRVRIYERAPVLGGRTRTYRQGRFCLAAGAGFVTNFYPRVFAFGAIHGYAPAIR